MSRRRGDSGSFSRTCELGPSRSVGAPFFSCTPTRNPPLACWMKACESFRLGYICRNLLGSPIHHYSRKGQFILLGSRSLGSLAVISHESSIFGWQKYFQSAFSSWSSWINSCSLAPWAIVDQRWRGNPTVLWCSSPEFSFDPVCRGSQPHFGESIFSWGTVQDLTNLMGKYFVW